MFRFLRQPEFYLRLSLGLMYIYSGYSLISTPENWQAFLTDAPIFITRLTEIVGPENFLRVQGVVELLIAFTFLAWFIPKRIVSWFALLGALEVASILVAVGVNAITFRDVGLLGAFIALALLLRRF